MQCKLSGYPVGEVKKIICPGENKNNRGFEYVIEFADKQEEIVMDTNLWPINENSLESQSDESESDDSSEDPDEEDHLIRDTVEEDAQKEKKAEKKSSVLSTAIPNPVPIAVAEAVPNIAAGRKPKNKATADVYDPHFVDDVMWEDQETVDRNVERVPITEVSYRLRKPHWINGEAHCGVNEPFLYFLCLFPGIGEIQRAEDWGAEDAAPGNSEIVKFLGIMLAMALDPIRGSRKDHWTTSSDDNDIFDDDNVKIIPSSPLTG